MKRSVPSKHHRSYSGSSGSTLRSPSPFSQYVTLAILFCITLLCFLHVFTKDLQSGGSSESNRHDTVKSTRNNQNQHHGDWEKGTDEQQDMVTLKEERNSQDGRGKTAQEVTGESLTTVKGEERSMMETKSTLIDESRKTTQKKEEESDPNKKVVGHHLHSEEGTNRVVADLTSAEIRQQEGTAVPSDWTTSNAKIKTEGGQRRGEKNKNEKRKKSVLPLFDLENDFPHFRVSPFFFDDVSTDGIKKNTLENKKKISPFCQLTNPPPLTGRKKNKEDQRFIRVNNNKELEGNSSRLGAKNSSSTSKEVFDGHQDDDDDVVCLSGNPTAWQEFVVVVTVTEEEILQSLQHPSARAHELDGVVDSSLDEKTRKEKSSHDPHALSWLDEIPLCKIIYVKSNNTKSWRKFTDRGGWDPLLRKKLDSEVMYSQTASQGKKRRTFEERSTSSSGERGKVRVFRSTARDLYFKHKQCMEFVELPNIGDESLSMVQYITDYVLSTSAPATEDRNNKSFEEGNRKGGKMRERRKRDVSKKNHVKMMLEEEGEGNRKLMEFLSPFPYTIFLHSHRSSWHSYDIIREVLSCVCMDRQTERYKTLTFAENAFMLQCMPLRDVNASSTISSSSSLHIKKGTTTTDEIFPLPHENTTTTTATATDVPEWRKKLHRYETRMLHAALNTSRKYKAAWDTVVQSVPWRSSNHKDQEREERGLLPTPQAIIRDCCASMIVRSDAFLQRPQAFWKQIRSLILSQPIPRIIHGADNITFIDDSELSLYLESFWRTYFSSTETDFYRDFTNLRCKYLAAKKQLKTEALFDCPPFMQVKELEDIPEDYRNRKCPKWHNNFYQ